ncbi:MAG: ATP-dependent DNA helicase [Deltaproteobacteria bacterium]|jgi:ATP-dependent DNA helicase DinG|nr:ATP-dependent DNA helicase [Deltaproteobacteria bacterium]
MPPPKHELPREIPADLRELEPILQRGGPLDSGWKEFEPRESQQRMFLETARAFRKGEISLIEAGTGTGKTLAYLLPALISGKKTFISTGLKNLQEQILTKDLFFIREHFEKEFKAVALKGRQNYLCKRLLESLGHRGPGLLYPDFDASLKIIKSWAGESESGELDELKRLPVDLNLDPPFDRLSTTSDNCLGQACPFHEDCFVTKIRKKAQDADLVLVNHHLFMADLALRRRTPGFLPDWEAIVFDEAHLLLDVATEYFSYKSSTFELLNAGKFLEQVVSWELNKEKENTEGYMKALERLKGLAETIEEDALFVSSRYQGLGEEVFLWPPGPERGWSKNDRDFKTLLENLSLRLEEMTGLLEEVKDKNDDFKRILSDLSAHAEALGFIVENEDESYVYQVKGGRDVELAAVPVDVSPFLSQNLFNKNRTIVVCSATLSARGSFDYFKAKTGIGRDASELVLSSPFDYEKNSVFYIPNDMPPPPEGGDGSPKYDRALVAKIEELLEITEGRALVLFTSFRQMNMTRDALSRESRPYRLLHQEPGTAKGRILDDFKRDTHSVLLATHSFWQGVDIPGQSLSAVIIDKIPFPRPHTPVNKTRQKIMERAKANFFHGYLAPEATLSLKQGLGRLLRTGDDWGLLSILDSRIHLKPYGPEMLKNLDLPPRIVTTRLSDVKKFFREKSRGRDES